MKSIDCVVVGGGPAGLAAARVASQAGVEVMLVDENQELGGRYYRRATAGLELSGEVPLRREAVVGRRLIEEVRAACREVRLGTVVWGVFDGPSVTLASADSVECVQARNLILAPGAYDRPVPFPGWTLPGVVTAGGTQNLLKDYGILPGSRVAVAGSGPQLPVIAHDLLTGGARVEAVCEAAPLRGLWRYVHRALPHFRLVRQGDACWRGLRAARVPILRSHIIRRALGVREVTGAVVSRCDASWRPIEGTEQLIEADTLVIGYGFIPSVELSRVAGCEHRYVAGVDAWLPVRTEDLETTVPGVFVVGDAAGGSGAAFALAEGRLAGLAVAQRLEKVTEPQYGLERARLRARLHRLASLREILDVVYRPGPGLYTLADEETVLCRCEEVTMREARGAIADGAVQLNEVKAWIRTGMGRCQGRMCGPSLAHLISDLTGRPLAEAAAYTARPPVKPVRLGAFVHASADISPDCPARHERH